MPRYYSTQQFTWTNAALAVILNAFKTNPAAALFPTLKLQLGKDVGFVIGPDSALADAQAQQADFTDYVEAAITLTGPANVKASVKAMLGLASFLITTTPVVTGNNIYNYYLYSGTLLVGGEKFSGGGVVPMATPGDYLDLIVELPNGNYVGTV